MAKHPGDYDFITQLVQFMEEKLRTIFFISSKDFDVMYNWWEKKIPLAIIKESIFIVAKRWSKKGKKITGFSNFNYQVRKDFNTFLELEIGESTVSPEKSEIEELEFFLSNFPEELAWLKGSYLQLARELKSGRAYASDKLDEELLALFADNAELNLKTDFFLTNLAPELQKPEIKKRYRLNFLRNRFGIPDFR